MKKQLSSDERPAGKYSTPTNPVGDNPVDSKQSKSSATGAKQPPKNNLGKLPPTVK